MRFHLTMFLMVLAVSLGMHTIANAAAAAAPAGTPAACQLPLRASISLINARASSPSGIGLPLSRHATAALKPSAWA